MNWKISPEVQFKDIYVKYLYMFHFKSVIGMVRTVKNVIITLVLDIEKYIFLKHKCVIKRDECHAVSMYYFP